MGKVFVEMGVALDGFIAGPNGGPGNPLGDGGLRIHQWVYQLASWRERLGLAGGETNRDDELVKASYARSGAYVMGRRMFDEGEVGWPDNPPFRVPVFVVTHKARKRWVRVRLFDQVGSALALEGIEVIESPLVTHLKYQVGK